MLRVMNGSIVAKKRTSGTDRITPMAPLMRRQHPALETRGSVGVVRAGQEAAGELQHSQRRIGFAQQREG